MSNTSGHTKPPAGAIRGESVPVENEVDTLDERERNELRAQLKARGPPFSEMSERELDEHIMKRIKRSER